MSGRPDPGGGRPLRVVARPAGPATPSQYRELAPFLPPHDDAGCDTAGGRRVGFDGVRRSTRCPGQADLLEVAVKSCGRSSLDGPTLVSGLPTPVPNEYNAGRHHPRVASLTILLVRDGNSRDTRATSRRSGSPLAALDSAARGGNAAARAAPESETGAWNAIVACHTTDGRPRASTRLSDRTSISPRTPTPRLPQFGIACEACHGPAEEHARVNASVAPLLTAFQRRADPTIVQPRRLNAGAPRRCAANATRSGNSPINRRTSGQLPGAALSSR